MSHFEGDPLFSKYLVRSRPASSHRMSAIMQVFCTRRQAAVVALLLQPSHLAIWVMGYPPGLSGQSTFGKVKIALAAETPKRRREGGWRRERRRRGIGTQVN